MNAPARYKEADVAEKGGIIEGVKAEIDKVIAEKVTPRFNQLDKVLEEVLKRLPPANPPSP